MKAPILVLLAIDLLHSCSAQELYCGNVYHTGEGSCEVEYDDIGETCTCALGEPPCTPNSGWEIVTVGDNSAGTTSLIISYRTLTDQGMATFRVEAIPGEVVTLSRGECDGRPEVYKSSSNLS